MRRLIAEFEEQSFTQIIFPHLKTDWIEYLDESENNFINIINTIIKYQKCLVVCYNKDEVKAKFQNHKNLFFVEYETNDTWARDCSAISMEIDSKLILLDFTFNAWGEKFSYKKDNAMTKNLAKYYSNKTQTIDFILEGGAIESNGDKLLLTTSECMLNRNKTLNKKEITKELQKYFGVSNILYLNHGYLAGDDTNSHIDTLARFIDEKTIMYVECSDEKDEHYKELSLMKKELLTYAKLFNLKLIALPMCEKIYFEGERLPATYANFLFVNKAVLVPIYGVKEDKEALEIFKKTFKNKKIEAINCSTLIKQHGSLHCVSMNFHKTSIESCI
jgi:agmatine/peptidylarginine deiminase